jgi:hypothetical protein
MSMHGLRLVVLSNVAWLVIGSKGSRAMWHMQEERRDCSRYRIAGLKSVAKDLELVAGGFTALSTEVN